MCCCGLNTIVNLPANIADKSDGVAVDVSGLQGRKTIEISGSYSGTYSILGSHDGNLFFPVASFGSGAGTQTVRKTLEVVAHFLKVHREAAQSGRVTVNVAARATVACATNGQGGANNFFTLATLPMGASGPQAALDLFTLVAATGIDVSSVACAGAFRGQISVEGSLDGINFSPLAGFLSSQAQRGSSAAQVMFDPVVVEEVVRFVRANVLQGTVVTGPTSLTIGGPQNCDCAAAVVNVNEAMSFTEFGNYMAPQTFSSAAGATSILGQWWFDFSRLSTVTINIFLGIEAESDGNGTARFGLFILPDGDPLIGDLFNGLQPVVTASVANVNAFHGYDGNATIARPAGLKQVLLAAQPTKSGGADVTISWRSALVQAAEVV